MNQHDADPTRTERQTGRVYNRRQLIGRLAAAGFSAPVIASILSNTPAAAWQATPMPEGTPSPETILASIGKDPRLISYSTTNFGTPLELVESLRVPNELFFIRSNGPVSVDIAPETWRLAVTGLVETELDLGLADLEAMPTRSITSFLECSGNSRGRFRPEAEGTQWGNTGVGNAEWTGVSLSAVLDQAGVLDGAIDIVTQGGDFPEMQRGLPLEMARNPDTMLVWQMNGAPLPAPNGGPVRLLVPGWGGIASTKWIVGIDVIDRPFDGHYNVESYVIINEAGQVVRPVTVMPVKSVITSPMPDAQLTAGPQAVAGFAWSGYGGITKVEVSTDSGVTWVDAPIVDEAGRLSWVRFEAPWEAVAGEAKLRSRATDERGLTQPDDAEWNAKGYQMNGVYEVPVTVA
ncbi:MAG: sulfite oxidase [Chloroflexia bacterium]|nr:sulfite oxidase [Chloroflexia bacterium]